MWRTTALSWLWRGTGGVENYQHIRNGGIENGAERQTAIEERTEKRAGRDGEDVEEPADDKIIIFSLKYNYFLHSLIIWRTTPL